MLHTLLRALEIFFRSCFHTPLSIANQIRCFYHRKYMECPSKLCPCLERFSTLNGILKIGDVKFRCEKANSVEKGGLSSASEKKQY